MSLKEHFTIDQSALHEEWLKQPDLMWRYTKKQADARLAFQTAQNQLEAVDAELSIRVRENPTKYGLKSVFTETALREKIATHTRHKEAVRQLMDARHHLDVMDAAVKTLDQKSRALVNLVDLHAQGYFAAPRIKWRNEKQPEQLRNSADKIRPVRRVIGQPK